MNIETQPEALRLADALENGSYLLSVERAATCAELRRLHAIEAEHIKLCRDYQDTWDSRDRLHAENQQLRTELEAIGAGGVGPLIPAASSGHTKQHLGMASAEWKLVPVDLTKAMQAAGEAAWAESYSQYKNGILHMYRAMLAVAPQPPETARS